MSSGSSEERWYSTPQTSRWPREQTRPPVLTDTLSSNDSTGSSDLSNELAGRLGIAELLLQIRKSQYFLLSVGFQEILGFFYDQMN